MNNETEKPALEESEPLTGRREALLKMGKFAAYAAPFTVLALNSKAKAATGHGPGDHDGHGKGHGNGHDHDHDAHPGRN